MIFPGSWRMRKAVWIGVVALAACMPAASVFGASGFGSKDKMDPPQWGLDAAKTRAPGYAKDAAAVILYDEYLETIDAQGRDGEREGEGIRILKPQGRGNSCGVSFDVNEKINYFRVWTIAADEKRYQSQSTD